MRLHLFLAPVQALPKSVQVLEHGVIAGGWRLFPEGVILNKVDFQLFIQRVKELKFSLLDGNDV